MTTATKKTHVDDNPTMTGPVAPEAKPEAPFGVDLEQPYVSERSRLRRIADKMFPARVHGWVDVAAKNLARRGLTPCRASELGIEPNDETPIQHGNSMLVWNEKERFLSKQTQGEDRSMKNIRSTMYDKNTNEVADKNPVNIEKTHRPKTLDQLGE